MNEDYVNFTPISEPSGEPEPARPLSWQDAAALILALALSILFWSVFSFENAFDRGYGPGLGVPVFVAAHFAAVFLLLRPRIRAGGAAMAAAAMLLAVSCALYAHVGLTILNCFVILLLSAMATFSFSGHARFCVLDIRSIPDTIRLSVFALFTCIDSPFEAAKQTARGKKLAFGRILGTVLITAVLLGIVLALLASADMVFGSFFSGVRRWINGLSPAAATWRIARAFVLMLFICSALFFVRTPADTDVEERPEPERRAIPFLVPALALDLVYIIFCAVQIRYLFGGAETAAMSGGWAEYARSGFFELVAVAAINLALCVLSARKTRLAAIGGRLLRIACAVMLALTAFILSSALYRMGLYIAAFGLSILRLMTLWGMLVIAFGILTAFWKLGHPDSSFWKIAFPFVLGTWCLLCLANPAGRIADHNVDAYLSQRLVSVDVEYLEALGPDTAPALTRLADSSGEYASAARDTLLWMEQTAHETDAGWASLKAAFRYLEK